MPSWRARRRASLLSVATEGRTLSVSADATDPDSVAAAFEKVRGEMGDPEVFVYNAGAFQMCGILELSPEAIAETYWQLRSQDRTAWTLDLRPAVESF